MILQLLSWLFFGYSFYFLVKEKKIYGVVPCLYFLSYALSTMINIPYLFYFNTLMVVFLLLLVIKERIFLLTLPLLILRLSQLFHMPGMHITLIICLFIFILIISIFLFRRKISLISSNFLIAIGAILIETVNYFE